MERPAMGFSHLVRVPLTPCTLSELAIVQMSWNGIAQGIHKYN